MDVGTGGGEFVRDVGEVLVVECAECSVDGEVRVVSCWCVPDEFVGAPEALEAVRVGCR